MLNNIRTLIILNKQEFRNAKAKNPYLRSMRGKVMSYYKATPRQIQNKLERSLCGVVKTSVSPPPPKEKMEQFILKVDNCSSYIFLIFKSMTCKCSIFSFHRWSNLLLLFQLHALMAKISECQFNILPLCVSSCQFEKAFTVLLVNCLRKWISLRGFTICYCSSVQQLYFVSAKPAHTGHFPFTQDFPAIFPTRNHSVTRRTN